MKINKNLKSAVVPVVFFAPSIILNAGIATIVMTSLALVGTIFAITLPGSFFLLSGLAIYRIGKEIIVLGSFFNKNSAIAKFFVNIGVVIQKSGEYLYLAVTVPIYAVFFRLPLWMLEKILNLTEKILNLAIVEKIFNYIFEKILRPFFRSIAPTVHVILDIIDKILRETLIGKICGNIMYKIFLMLMHAEVAFEFVLSKMKPIIYPVLELTMNAFQLTSETVRKLLNFTNQK